MNPLPRVLSTPAVADPSEPTTINYEEEIFQSGFTPLAEMLHESGCSLCLRKDTMDSQ